MDFSECVIVIVIVVGCEIRSAARGVARRERIRSTFEPCNFRVPSDGMSARDDDTPLCTAEYELLARQLFTRLREAAGMEEGDVEDGLGETDGDGETAQDFFSFRHCARTCCVCVWSLPRV